MREQRTIEKRLSVIIVNYGAKEYADKCVRSILDSHSADYEVIVVDNGSPDGSVEFLRDKYADRKDVVRVIALDQNYGPAKARNVGVAASGGKYIAFLDNDTEVHPDWANTAIAGFEQDEKLGIIQCKLLLAKERDKIDYVGEYIGGNGFLVQRAPAGERDEGQYDQKIEILAAKSAGMFIRRETFDRIGGFDEDYFIYVEETDLGWRSWLAGYRAVFLPASVVYHEFGTSALVLGRSKNNYNTKFHGTKNYILTLFKNLDTGHLFTIWPTHILLWKGLAWFSLIRGDFNAFRWIYGGILWNVRHFPDSLKKRKAVQSKRRISDGELFPIVMRKKPFRYYFQKATAKHKIGNAEGFNRAKR